MYIYKTTNLITGKQYIGQHSRNDDAYIGSGKLLKAAIDKYGKENFHKEILEYCESKSELDLREQYYISLYDAVNNSQFYNLNQGGTGGYNAQAVEANKKKKGKTWEEIYSAEGLKIMRNSKFCNNKGEDNPFFGKTHTIETKQKFAANAKKLHTGKKRTTETRQNISNGIKNSIKHKDAVSSPEYKDRVSKSVKSVWNDINSVYNSEEYRSKLSKSQSIRWANNVKITKEQMIECISKTKNIHQAMLFFISEYKISISRPTFDKYRRKYNL